MKFCDIYQQGSAGSDERSPHHVVERSTYGASECAVFI